MRILALLVCVLLLAPQRAFAAEPGPAWGTRGMVVTSVGPAADAGREILGRGGNAVDAAIATAFAAGVAHQYSSGIGGGAFAVVYMAESGQVAALDARETAPRSANEAVYLDSAGKAMPDVIRSGPKSVAVPGLVQGLWELHEKYGSLEWKELVKPAIRLCTDGVEVSPMHRRMLQIVAPRLAPYPETARTQLDRGQVPALGWRLVQPDLARTLAEIGERGGGALAYGAIARKIVDATGGVLTLDDLAAYRPIWREPVRGKYRGLEIVSMPPPSSGGVLLVQMLKVLEPFDLAALGLNSSESVNLIAGAMKLAFADRAEYMGDPDYWQVPVDVLTSDAYAGKLSDLLRPPPFFLRAPWRWGDPVIPSTRKKPLTVPPDDKGTTQISVVDAQGNAVSLTQTVNTLFGSLITVPGTGIVLNNEMDDFSLPGTPNAWGAVGTGANSVQPGKRPLSSMTPTVVLENGQVRYVIGSPMGTFIITAVLQTLLNSVDYKLAPEQAVAMPRFHQQWSPDALMVEVGHPRDVIEDLESFGHVVRPSPYPMGAVQLIARDGANATWLGATDPRRDGAALGY